MAARARRRPARRRRARGCPVRHPRHLGDLEPHRRAPRRPARHRCHERQPHHAHGPGHPGLGRGTARVLRGPPGDAADDPVQQRPRRVCRDGLAERLGRPDPHHRRSRRPAGGHRRAGVFRGRRGEEHLRHRQLHAPEHRHRTGALPRRPAHHGRLPARRRTRCLRPRRLDRRHRQRGPVAARPARDHPQRRRGRDPGRLRVRRGRHLLCPGVLRPIRSVLALRRPGRARRAVPVQHRRPPGPGDPRGDLLPDQGRRRRDVRRLRRPPGHPQGRRRSHRQRALHADPGRRPRRRRLKPVVAETTALGAAYGAGLATGFWRTTDELRANWQEDRRWSPQWSDEQRTSGYAGWRKAVDRTLDWTDVSK